MDNGQLKEVMMDVRQAQRLLVAFYKRVMPLINDLSAELGCEHFHYWNLWKNNPYPDLSGQLTKFGGKGAAFGCKVNLEAITDTDSLEAALTEFKQRLVDYQFRGE